MGIVLLDDSRWSVAERLSAVQAEDSRGVALVRGSRDLPMMGPGRGPVYVLRAGSKAWSRDPSADTNDVRGVALYADRRASMGVIAKSLQEDIKATRVAFAVKRALDPERTKVLGRFATFQSDPTGMVDARFDAVSRPLTPRRLEAWGRRPVSEGDVADDVVLVVKPISVNAIEVDGRAIALASGSDERPPLPHHIGAIRYDFEASDTLERALQTVAAMQQLYGARVYTPGETYFTVEGVD